MATYVDFIFKMEVSSLFDPVGHLVNQAYIFSIFFLKKAPKLETITCANVKISTIQNHKKCDYCPTHRARFICF